MTDVYMAGAVGRRGRRTWRRRGRDATPGGGRGVWVAAVVGVGGERWVMEWLVGVGFFLYGLNGPPIKIEAYL